MYMSELILPGHVEAAKRAHVERELSGPDAEKEAKLAQQLPAPAGYKMLVGLPKIEEKYASGIIKADSIVKNDEIATVVGFIIKQGPDCYKDPAKFPTGPFCKEGDFVLMRAYSGTRFKLHDIEFRLINDDAVEAVVQDPRGYSRV
jgi:co-chaperonin GroES (HSP10)